MMHFNPPVVDGEKLLNFGAALQENAAKHGEKARFDRRGPDH